VTTLALIGQGCEVRRHANHKSIAWWLIYEDRPIQRLACGTCLRHKENAVAILRHAEIDSQIV
jgi:hypothetical protein